MVREAPIISPQSLRRRVPRRTGDPLCPALRRSDREAVASVTNRLPDVLTIARLATLFDVYSIELEALLSFPPRALEPTRAAAEEECVACAAGLHGIAIAAAPAASR
jgi:hypothetical protein